LILLLNRYKNITFINRAIFLKTIMKNNLETLTKGYLQKAVRVLDQLGIQLQKGEESQLATLLQDVVTVSQPEVLAIAETLQYISTFSQMVRDNVEDMNVSQRYKKITGMFNSIRDDSKKLVEQLADGKISAGERTQQWLMKFTRGTPHKRFEKIRDLYNDVTRDTKGQLDKEKTIMDGYMDFRFALKDAETLAYKVMETQEKNLNATKEKFSAAKAAFNDAMAKSISDQNKSRLQLERDEADRAVVEEDRRYQLIKDVAGNLKNGYNVGEVLVARLSQTHQLKDQVYRKAISFFTTNEHVFTVMDAVYTASYGLHETTQTVEAMKEGMNKGLEDIASMERELDKAALEAGYGSTFNAPSVQKLVDAIVAFQTESTEEIARLRKESADSAKLIEAIVEDGKKRFYEARVKYLAEPVKPAN